MLILPANLQRLPEGAHNPKRPELERHLHGEVVVRKGRADTAANGSHAGAGQDELPKRHVDAVAVVGMDEVPEGPVDLFVDK